MHKNIVGIAFLTLFITSTTANAYIPEPQSEGRYFSGKGTRASEEYEANAGMPTYDYAKGIQWGPVHFKPSARYDAVYTDNVFYSDANEESDFIHRLSGELLAELPLSGGQHLLSAAYGITHEFFTDFDAQDHTDHRAMIGLNLNFVPFTLGLENTFETTVSRANTEFTDRIQRDENAFHSLLEVPFATFFLENEITDFDIGYDRPIDQVFDHNLFNIYQRIGYDLTPNTQLLGEYGFTNIDYSNFDDRNGEGHQGMVGLRGKLTERVAYQAWVGYQDRVYDLNSTADFHDVVARGALQWDPSETNRFVLRMDRSPQESTFDNQSFYTRNRAELQWRLQIAERWFVNTRGSVAFHEYSRITVVPATGEAETREDWNFDAGTGLEYRMPNDIVSLILDYRYGSRDVNLNGLDYESNEVLAGIRANF